MKTLLETEGIILRSMKYSETSIIIDLLTKNYGLRSFIINGVRSSKSKSGASIFQVMNILNIAFYDKDTDALLRLTHYSYNTIYQSLNIDIFKSAIGSFMAEITRNSIKEKGEFAELYMFIKQSFTTLDLQPLNTLPNFYINYILELTRYLGFHPHNNYSDENIYFDMLNGYFTDRIIETKYTMTHEVSKILHNVLFMPSTKLHPHDRDILIDELLVYFKLHIENFKELKSLQILRDTFS